MIRPFTFLTMLLAGGSGLYLYSAKHQSQVLDRDIAKTVKLTDAVHERTEMLRAEWALLNEPDRLAELAKAHLNLKTLAPTQFVALHDLASRLPPPAPPGSLTPPPGTTDTDDSAAPPPGPVAQATPTPPPAPAPAKPASPATPQAPAPAPVVAQAAPPAPKPAPVPAAHPAPTAVAEAKAPPPRHVLPRPVPVETVAVSSRAPLPVMTVSANAASTANPSATAPGTIGESVLRAMRANAYAAPTAYTPRPYTPPAYTPPAPTYAPVAQASAGSLLGGAAHAALPPPVPFAAR